MTMSAILETRLALYRLLSKLYRYPLEREALEAIQSLEMPVASPLVDALSNLQKVLMDMGSASREERLNVEMTRLMEGPGLTPAPPYASYYLHSRQLMGPSAQAARRAYLEWQVLPEEGSIPPDHVALELGFLAVLAERALELELPMNALRASREFLHLQVLSWVPCFCAEIEKNSREPFFTALARWTLQTIEADSAWLEDVLTDPVSIELSNSMNN